MLFSRLVSSNVGFNILLLVLVSLYLRQGRTIKARRFPMTRKTRPCQKEVPSPKENYNLSIGLYDLSNAPALQLLLVHLKSLRERRGRSAMLMQTVQRMEEKKAGLMRIALHSQIEMSIDSLFSKLKIKTSCFASASLFR